MTRQKFPIQALDEDKLSISASEGSAFMPTKHRHLAEMSQTPIQSMCVYFVSDGESLQYRWTGCLCPACHGHPVGPSRSKQSPNTSCLDVTPPPPTGSHLRQPHLLHHSPSLQPGCSIEPPWESNPGLAGAALSQEKVSRPPSPRISPAAVDGTHIFRNRAASSFSVIQLAV